MLKRNNGSKNQPSSLASTRVLTTRFFQLIMERQFAEAERILERLRTMISENEWNRGFVQALNGMILARKSNDERYAFLANLSFDDEKTLQKNRREFLNHVGRVFHADYDRGFFLAWVDFLKIILKSKEKFEKSE